MDPKTYEAILDSINSSIVFVDNNHIIRYLNKVARIRYYEKRGYSGLIGKSLFDCHDPALQEAIMCLHERLLAGENEIFLMDDDGDSLMQMIEPSFVTEEDLE